MSDMALDYQRRPITVDEFERMAEIGIFEPDERVELLDGELILMPPMNPPHFGSVARLNQLFVVRLAGRAVVSPQLPLRISRISEPMPDFAILFPREDFYATERPGVETTYALVECSDTSLAYDRGKKRKAYARANICEYWIVDINARRIEVNRDPHDFGYRATHVAEPGDSLAFLAFPEIAFSVAELVGT